MKAVQGSRAGIYPKLRVVFVDLFGDSVALSLVVLSDVTYLKVSRGTAGSTS